MVEGIKTTVRKKKTYQRKPHRGLELGKMKNGMVVKWEIDLQRGRKKIQTNFREIDWDRSPKPRREVKKKERGK